MSKSKTNGKKNGSERIQNVRRIASRGSFTDQLSPQESGPAGPLAKFTVSRGQAAKRELAGESSLERAR